MRPPFDITSRSASLLADIERLVGRHEGALAAPPNPMLRRSHRVRTVHASLAIEGNTLTEEQVTSVLEGKTIVAPERDLREVRNAIACYENLPRWKPGSAKHLLLAHKMMMNGLVGRAGAWRGRGVGIARGSVIAHVAPPADRVAGLISDLLDWIKKDSETPGPIKAAVCHYEMEFIHPFEDGNGRMGRLWHSLILLHHHTLFAQVPVESAIRDRQTDYYAVLGQCDKAGNSSAFIEFSLELTLESLRAVSALPKSRMSSQGRLAAASDHFGSTAFSRKEYLALFPGISAPTASRDLQDGVTGLMLVRSGDKAMARYQFQ